MSFVADPILLNPPLLFESILHTKTSKRLEKILHLETSTPPHFLYSCEIETLVMAGVGRKEAVTAARHQHHHIIIPMTVAAAAAPPPVCEVRPMFTVGSKANHRRRCRVRPFAFNQYHGLD